MGELISVIIPCYNVEKYLDRCMQSVLNQTYRDLEIILVDDGSTDGTGKMCDRYALTDARVKVIHKKNDGAASARNFALKEMTGEYVGFVDSDDWIEPDFYSYLYNLIVRYRADIAQCAYVLTDGSKKPVRVGEEIQVIDQNQLMDIFFRTKGEISGYGLWNRLYKQEILKGIVFPNGYINEDLYYLYFCFLNTGLAVVSNQRKYHYFINENGITRGALKKQDLSLYYVWDQVIKDTKKNNKQYYEKAVLNRKRAIFTLLSKYVVYGVQDRDIFSKRWVRVQTRELRKAYGRLMRSESLDVKRKLMLSFLCVSPRMACCIYRNLEKNGIKVK